MTHLERLNFWILQWLFVRLARVINDDGNQIGWTLLRWPLPMSGWDGRSFRYLGGKRKG